MESITIKKTIDDNLCTGCGTCIAMCPCSAIKLVKTIEGVFKPELQTDLCIQCGLCSSVCPGSKINFTQLNRVAFSNSDLGHHNEDLLLGRFLTCYVGHSSKKEIIQHSASGGLVTALLVSALEENIIDGALVTRMSQDNPLMTEAFIARTPAEVLSASRSKYCPVAANVALMEILENDGRYAVVGLPCHLHGLRKAEAVNDILRKRIIFHFGIFCSHTVNFRGTEYLLQRLGISNQNDISAITYRDKGWPGGFFVRLKDGSEKFIPHHSYWAPIFGRFFFSPMRCILCPDGLAELADISFGDAWLPEFRREKTGRSILLARSVAGQQLIDLAIKRGDVVLMEVDARKVLQSQRDQILFKKKNLPARANLVRLLGKNVPHFEGVNFLKPNFWDRIISFIPFLNAKISNTKLGYKLLLKAPDSFLRIYGYFIQKLFNKSYDEYRNIHLDPIATLPPKIIIINSYSPNIGDLSIIISMIDCLRAKIPNAEFSVFATNPQLTSKHIDGVSVYRSLSSRSGKLWRQTINFFMLLRNWCWIYFRKKGVNLFFLVRRKTRHALYEYIDADVIVSCGGGYLNDNSGCAFLGCLFDIYLGSLTKKTVMLYAQSIGPFSNKWLKRIAKKVLNNVDLIALRDEVSVKFLEELGVKTPRIFVTADAALLLPKSETKTTYELLNKLGIDPELPLVTVTTKPWHFPTAKNPVELKQKYLTSLTALCKHIISQYDANILFIPMDIINESKEPKKISISYLVKMTKGLIKKAIKGATEPVFRNEAELIQKVLRNLNGYKRVYTLNSQYTPSEIKGIIGKSTIHVATRMHSSIYAASLGIPILGIAYEPKMVSFMKRLRQDNFTTLIEDVVPQALITKFDKLWAEKEHVSMIIRQNADELMTLACFNSKILMELLPDDVGKQSENNISEV